jgi:hypothetical protein
VRAHRFISAPGSLITTKVGWQSSARARAIDGEFDLNDHPIGQKIARAGG